MNEPSLRRCFSSWRLWLAACALWSAVCLVEQSGTYTERDGKLVWVGIQWRFLWDWLRWYVPALPSTVLFWWAAHRMVDRTGFWRLFVNLVIGTSLFSAMWLPMWGNFEWTGFGLGWVVHYLPRYAAVFGTFVAFVQVTQRESSRRELLATQLRALRSQLQPHFLFNTLHAIGVTCKQDGVTAARMTTLLGDLLRQTLRERGGELVSLAEEHELLQPYLQLQQLRFGDRLHVDVDLPANVLGGAVPDLVLQPLVENALQHGIEQRPGDGHVRVVGRREGDRLRIDVHDDGVGLPAGAGEPTLGTGLGATKARLQALFGDRASLSLRGNDRGGTTASLELPWREVAHAA